MYGILIITRARKQQCLVLILYFIYIMRLCVCVKEIEYVGLNIRMLYYAVCLGYTPELL